MMNSVLSTPRFQARQGVASGCFLLAVTLLSLSVQLVAGSADVAPFNTGWTFSREGRETRVTLPHDWIVEGQFDPRADQSVARFGNAYGTGVYRKSFRLEPGRWSLCFDGVMDQSVVLLDGVPVYSNAYGYTSFEVSLDGAATNGAPTTVEVQATVERGYTRFYAGAGIYRNVWLRRRKDGDGPYYEHTGTAPLPLPKKLKGVCLHADNGPLGMAATAESQRRQFAILKAMGVNAVRTSHNPASPQFLDLAAEAGFLVMEEAFDYWRVPKTGGGYQKCFMKEHERDLRAMVRRDRGRQNVVMWSLGNEVVEQSPSFCRKNDLTDALSFGRHLRDIVREEDPLRPTTVACWNGDTVSNGFDRVADVFGANYLPNLYKTFLDTHRDVRIVGSETCSVLSSRGDYFFPVDLAGVEIQQTYTNGFVNGRVSSYDVSTCRNNNCSPDIEFRAQDDNPAVLGEFVWTGFDYLSEPTPYDNTARSSYYGIVDLCGFPKDRFYLYQAHWRPDFPMAHILPHWTWPGREGLVTPVHVYSSGDEAELFVNGVSQGRRRRGPREYRFMWNDVVYAPGELRVQTWKNGQPWATDRVVTAGQPVAVTLTMETDFPSFYRITAVDVHGNPCPTADLPVVITTTGDWHIKAVANGDPHDRAPFMGTNRVRTYNGLAQVIVDKRGAGSISAACSDR